jgi:hypothetical protein
LSALQLPFLERARHHCVWTAQTSVLSEVLEKVVLAAIRMR